MNMTIPANAAKNRASFQGSFFNQPNHPLPPRERPANSNVAKIENAVINEGTTTIIVRTTWRNFQNDSSPGSTNWWCNPTGTENKINNINVNLGNELLKIFPPTICGIFTYQ